MNKIFSSLVLVSQTSLLFGGAALDYELFNNNPTQSKIVYLFVHGLDGSKYQGFRYCDQYTNKEGIAKQNDNWIMQEPYAVFNFSEVPSRDYKEVDLGQEREMERLHEAYGKTRELLPNHDIVLVGVSRGAATVINFVATYQPAHIRALILESPFDHINSIINYLTRKWKLYWIPHIHKLSQFIFKKRFPALNFDGPVPQKTVEKIPTHIPIMFIHSHKDELIPFESSRSLYVQLCNAGHKKVHFVELHEGKHAQVLWGNDADLYHRAVHNFYKRYQLPYDQKYK